MFWGESFVWGLTEVAVRAAFLPALNVSPLSRPLFRLLPRVSFFAFEFFLLGFWPLNDIKSSWCFDFFMFEAFRLRRVSMCSSSFPVSLAFSAVLCSRIVYESRPGELHSHRRSTPGGAPCPHVWFVLATSCLLWCGTLRDSLMSVSVCCAGFPCVLPVFQCPSPSQQPYAHAWCTRVGLVSFILVVEVPQVVRLSLVCDVCSPLLVRFVPGHSAIVRCRFPFAVQGFHVFFQFPSVPRLLSSLMLTHCVRE